MQKNRKILIVDDEETIVTLLETILGVHGYESYACKNPAFAVSKAQDVSPDLILLDIAMPGIDGYEICQLLKNNEQTSHIPVLMVTALALNQDKIKGFESGADGFIFKPFEPQAIIKEIEKLLKSSGES